MPQAPPDPYRILFPMGVAFGLVGAGVWLAHAIGLAGYPGPLHITLMIQGFEQCFVLGFLLTAMPAFTHGPRCHPMELAVAVVAMAVFGAGSIVGAPVAAQVAYLASIALLGFAGIRRVARNPQGPPEEFLFVAFGLLLGAIGGALLLAAGLGAGPALPPRMAERLLSLGMVLSLVIGVGSLLVPTFAGMRDPLVIPGLAAPHQRTGRRQLYLGVIAAFALAFVAELMGFAASAGMSLRAIAATVMGLWVWKLTRLPRRDAPGFTLWTSGWLVIAGLWVATLVPAIAAAGLHVVFIGGFALLTIGVGTRVIVSHGKAPLAIERRAIDAWVLALFAGALALRLAAELSPAGRLHALGGSAALWIAAWLVWMARVWPLVLPPKRSPT